MIKKFLSESNSVKFWNIILMAPILFINIMAIKAAIYTYIYCYGYGAPLFTVELFGYNYVHQKFNIPLSLFNEVNTNWVTIGLFMQALLLIPWVIVLINESKKHYWIYLYPIYWFVALCEWVFGLVINLICRFNNLLNGTGITVKRR